MDRKIIFFDIDGTLFDHVTGRVLPSTIKALQELKKNPNIEIAIASGRAIYDMYTIDNIKEYFDTFVTINGQIIIHNNGIIYANYLKMEDLRKMKDIFHDLNMIYGLVGTTKSTISETNDFVKSCFDNVRMTLPEINPSLDKEEGIAMAWAFASDDEIKGLEKLLPDFSCVSWKINGCDIFPKEVSKASSVLWYAYKNGYKKEDIYAFGDGENDIEMISSVGVGIAMGNATESTKKNAKYVTDSSDKDGIYNALKHFKLI